MHLQVTPPPSAVSMQRAAAVGSGSQHIRTVDEKDPGLYEIDGYHVGKEREFPVPVQVIDAWNGIAESFDVHVTQLMDQLNIPWKKRGVEPGLCTQSPMYELRVRHTLTTHIDL
jgi:hypothetical protein